MRLKSNNGFDRLAPVYDRLARLVYGSSIIKAQTCSLTSIPSAAKVLILGGGTGKMLTDLVNLKPDCEVWYIEASARMMVMARERKVRANIHFIHGTITALPDVKFDVVITHFFLDLFSAPTLRMMIPTILLVSKPTVLWLASDFVNHGKWWEHVLLKIMYLFFRQVCSIEGDRLPEWNRIIFDAGLKKIRTNYFYGGFIESSVFTK